MKKILYCIMASLAFLACEKKLDKPKNFIEKDKLEDILYDISLFYSIKGLNSYGGDSIEKVDMQSILAKHGVDSATFSQNNRYYIELHKGVYREIQTKVLERIDAQKLIVDSLFEKSINIQSQLDAAPVLDSIQSNSSHDNIEQVLYQKEDIKNN
ncbi:DUF4296 domain-containing protein [Myroides sp. LJL119]